MLRVATISFFLLFGFCGSGVGQELLKWMDFEMMTQEVISIPELSKELLTDVYRETPSVFIAAYPTSNGKIQSVSHETATPPHFIWTNEELFFHAIDHYLVPVEVTVKGDSATYNFVTKSIGNNPRSQISGTVALRKEDGRWKVSEITLKK